MSFEKYKKDIFDFEYFDNMSKMEYLERLGEPDELSSCIGLIAISFQELDDAMSKCIWKILHFAEDLGNILTAELSFKNKVNLLASLIYRFKNERKLNLFPEHEHEYIVELIKSIFKCEELRNKVMHSTFLISRINKKNIRQKKTSRAKKGLIIINEEVNIHNLLNIYDFFVSMKMELEGLVD